MLGFGDDFWLSLVAVRAAGVRKLPEVVLCCVQVGNNVDKLNCYRLLMTFFSVESLQISLFIYGKEYISTFLCSVELFQIEGLY